MVFHSTASNQSPLSTYLNRLFLILGLFFFFSSHSSSAFAAETVEITSKLFSKQLIDEIDYLEDPDNSLTLEQLIKNEELHTFSPVTKSAVQFGYSKSTYWFRFKVKNSVRLEHVLSLEIKYPPLDRIEFFILNEKKLIHHRVLGDGQPFFDRDFFTRNYMVKFELPYQQQRTIFLKVDTSSSVSIPLILSSDYSYPGEAENSSIMLGVYYGIALGLLAYNLFLWISTRETAYFQYVGFVLFYAGFVFAMDGLSFPWWPEATYWQSRSLYVVGFIGGVFLALFSRNFLHTNEGKSKLDILFKAIAIMYCIFAIASYFGEVKVGAKLNALSMLLIPPIILASGIYRYIQGYRPARYFIFGMSFLVAGVILTAAGSLDLLPFYSDGALFLKIGSSLEMIFFSIALADRINSLKDQQAKSANEAQMAKAENEARKLYIDKIQSINDELEVAVKARSEFLANMSHEIRTPMNGVLGMLELVKDTELKEKQKNFIDVAYRSGNTLLALINDILDLSKIEAGKLELELLDFNLSQLISDLKNLFDCQIQDKGLDFIIKIDPDTSTWITGDRTRLWQVLTNLISNAIKFTSTGSVTIRIRTQSDGLVRFEVTDSGIGIPEDAQKKIFDSFTQADGSTTRKFGGTGLGLTISRKITTLMHGDIGVESRPGIGSTFWFTADLPSAKAPLNHQKVSEKGELYTSFEGKEVLLVEDNVVNQQVAFHMLKKFGVITTIANNGQEGADTAKEKSFDLIFMDVQMPVLDGYKATAIIREHQKDQKPTPIIALTAHSMEGDKQVCLDAGMDDYLTKPLQKKEIQKALSKWLS